MNKGIIMIALIILLQITSLQSQTTTLEIVVSNVDWLGGQIGDNQTQFTLKVELTGINPTESDISISWSDTCKFYMLTKYIGPFISANNDLGPCGQAFVYEDFPANLNTTLEEYTSFILRGYTNSSLPDGDYYIIPYPGSLSEGSIKATLVGVQIHKDNGTDTIIRYLDYETYEEEFIPQTTDDPSSGFLSSSVNSYSSKSTTPLSFNLIPLMATLILVKSKRKLDRNN